MSDDADRHHDPGEDDELARLAERVTELEIALTYQQQLSRDLDEVIQSLHATLESLRRRLDALEHDDDDEPSASEVP